MNSSFSDIFPILIRMVEKTSGQQFSESKDYYLEAKLRLVAKEWNIQSFDQFVHLIKTSPSKGLIQDINEALCVHESLFFRDPSVFDFLKDSIIPQAQSLESGSVKIWSAGCSSGQEPYSINFICKDLGISADILGTDFSRKILSKSQKGIYSTFEVQRGIAMNKLLTYFIKVDDNWSVRPEFRNNINFQILNLLSDFSYLPKFNIVFCRNVLIYMSPENRLNILSRITNQILPSGYLVLGSTETIPDVLKKDFVQENFCTFRKKNGE